MFVKVRYTNVLNGSLYFFSKLNSLQVSKLLNKTKLIFVCVSHTYLDKQVNIYHIDTKTVKSCDNLHLEELFKKELELFEHDANNSSYLLCKTLYKWSLARFFYCDFHDTYLPDTLMSIHFFFTKTSLWVIVIKIKLVVKHFIKQLRER